MSARVPCEQMEQEKVQGFDQEFINVGKALDNAQEKREKVQEQRESGLNKNQSCKSDFKCGNDEKRKVQYDKESELH